MGFQSMTDEQLLSQLSTVADSCVRVVEMPHAERHAVRGKLGASANEAGAMNAIFATMMLAEAERRGIA